ncbi:NADP-dependent oxidoreductase [Amycolatopsis nigrescens]|uniref:NADP-dependent oxidoreductase n=1 Tax=Amycolatopsis nigrescens TaxID=381445 RepID=UPI000375C1B0|nr:NADP-dependent oxidoreductase [Amycolatopsis nigrescens]
MAQAIRYARYGGPEVLTLDEIPTPEPGPGEVRVAVRAAGINAIDWKLRSGAFGENEKPDQPAGTGLEIAGTVEALGPGVEGLTKGQAVFGLVGTGALATHVLNAAENLVPKPEWLSFEEAVALPVAAETALRTLRYLGVRAGHTVLVHAAAGAVGLVASQLAIARGATVIGTASTARHEFLRELGVQPVVYGSDVSDVSDFDELAARVRAIAPSGIDRVLDASGRGVLALSVELTGDPRRVVTIADASAAEHGVRFSSGRDGAVPIAEVMSEVLPLIQRGELRVRVARTFPLAGAADAHRLSETGHLLGKIVIAV